MFGIENVATDVCGSSGDRNDELCARWMQLAAFMPIARNYYNGLYYNYTEQKTKGTYGSEFFYMDSVS